MAVEDEQRNERTVEDDETDVEQADDVEADDDVEAHVWRAQS